MCVMPCLKDHEPPDIGCWEVDALVEQLCSSEGWPQEARSYADTMLVCSRVDGPKPLCAHRQAALRRLETLSVRWLAGAAVTCCWAPPASPLTAPC